MLERTIADHDIGRGRQRDSFELPPLQRENIVDIRFRNEQQTSVPVDDLERGGRLISLVYKVLGDMETPPDGTADVATYPALSQAFAAKAIALAILEAAVPRTSRKLKAPTT
jgi:hypothetical protein